MRALIVTPAGPGSLAGNRVTAERWAQRLAELGHEVALRTEWQGEPADLLVALHARRSHASVVRFGERCPGVPILVGLAGTDVYLDLDSGGEVLDSLRRADRLVALQPLAAERLPAELRARVRVVHQSALPPVDPPAPAVDAFEACVLAHLRAVKDPLLAARAARLLPAGSRVRIVHAGEALEPGLAAAARREQGESPRYRWLGPIPRAEAARVLAASRLLVVTSKAEGGPNAISEAIACGVPVLATRIDGSVGLLGDDHPGLFEVGDAPALAALLHRAETAPSFLAALRARTTALAPHFTPEAEREAWRCLLTELAGRNATKGGRC